MSFEVIIYGHLRMSPLLGMLFWNCVYLHMPNFKEEGKNSLSEMLYVE
jgi:hypothetical protein